MKWLECSPELNPMEHIWNMLRRSIAARPRLPFTLQDLKIAHLEEWNSISINPVDNIIAFRENKRKAVLSV